MDHINGFKAAVAAVLGCLTALWGWFGWLVVAWVACMLLDYATGTAAALKAGKWSCKAAREGLWHKVGAMAAVLVAAILDGVLGLILDHIPALTLPFDYTVFLTVLVLVWYILTELGSIVEMPGGWEPLCLHGCPRLLQRWSPAWTVPEITRPKGKKKNEKGKSL